MRELNGFVALVYTVTGARDDYAKEKGIEPLAELVSWAYEGVDPRRMGLGPVPATELALRRAGLSFDDIGAIELNEAFAAQALAVQKGWESMGLSRDRFDEIVNQRGGAIALGHPLGCSGTKLTVTLANIMRDKEIDYGLVTMCVGLGQGGAMVMKRYQA